MYKGLPLKEVLQKWKSTQQYEIAALQACGFHLKGLREKPKQRLQKFRTQRTIHWDPFFQELIQTIDKNTLQYSSKQRAQLLHAIATCHEDLMVYRDAYDHTETIISLSKKLTAHPFGAIRETAIASWSLGSLGIRCDGNGASDFLSSEIAQKVFHEGTVQDILQVLQACATLNWKTDMFHTDVINIDDLIHRILKETPSDIIIAQYAWTLTILRALNVEEMKLPQDLIMRLNQINKIHTFGHGLYTTLLLLDGSLQWNTISSSLIALVQESISQYQSFHPKQSILEGAVHKELSKHFTMVSGVDVKIPHSGSLQEIILFPDLVLKWNDRTIYIEVQGPAHYCLYPGRDQPLGRTIIKSYLYRKYGLDLLEIPYFAICDPDTHQLSTSLLWKWMEK